MAVVADLKGSSHLGTGKWAQSTASIYQAATGGAVQVLDDFGADFVQIQGDGAFGLFWGEQRYERAMCAGITIKTFSQALTGRLEKRWPDGPLTGFKVGVASGRVLVKRIGVPRNPAAQEPVWAGKPVNYAAKAAQTATRHQMIVTGSVWDKIASNDYLTVSCDCKPSDTLWSSVSIDRLPDGEPEAQGRLLSSTWCSTHGSEYCAAVLAGERSRPGVEKITLAMQARLMQDAVFAKASRDRKSRRARRTLSR